MPERPGFDFEAAYRRFDRARRALDAEPSVEDRDRILAKRARDLAKAPTETRPAAETTEYVVVSIAGECFGFDTAFVTEVVAVRSLTPLPNAPAFVVGLLLQRGHVVPVLELRSLLAPPPQALQPGTCVVVLEAGGMRFAVAADAVRGVVSIPGSEIEERAAGRSALLRAVTPTAAIVDVEALASDPRILVDAGASRREAGVPAGTARLATDSPAAETRRTP